MYASMKSAITTEIITGKTSFFASKWIIERIPFLFNNNLDEYIIWKETLSGLIGVDSKSIVLVGSAAVGVSLNPAKNFRNFDVNSDIDIAIISTYYFDIAWHYLRNMGTKIYTLRPREKYSVIDHRTRLIFYGTIATDSILQLLPFAINWVNAIDHMKKISPTIGREINFRIYRDFESLRMYQSDNIDKIKDNLLKPKP
jgi:hypothetical protein